MMEKRACLSCASIPSRACTRSSPPTARTRPGAGPGRHARRARSTPSRTRSPRATRTARRPRSTRCGPTAARRTRRAGACASCPTSTPRSYPTRRSRRPRRAATCSPRARRAGAHEVVVNAPDPVVSLAELRPRAGGRGGRGLARADARARGGRRAYVHVLVNERREGGASLPHTHAQLYALDFVPRAGRARARALRRLRRADDGRQPAAGPRPGGGQAARARRRHRRRGRPAGALRVAPALPAHARPAAPARALRGRRADRRRSAARRAGAAGPPPRPPAAAEPLGPHGAARRRALLLADRHHAPPHPPGRPRARHRACT